MASKIREAENDLEE